MLILRLDSRCKIILQDRQTKKVFATLTRYTHPLHPGRGEAWKINFDAPQSTQILREELPNS